MSDEEDSPEESPQTGRKPIVPSSNNVKQGGSDGSSDSSEEEDAPVTDGGLNFFPQQPQFPQQQPHVSLQQPQVSLQQPQAALQQPQAALQQPQVAPQQPQFSPQQQPQFQQQQPQFQQQQSQFQQQQPQVAAAPQPTPMANQNSPSGPSGNSGGQNISVDDIANVLLQRLNINSDQNYGSMMPQQHGGQAMSPPQPFPGQPTPAPQNFGGGGPFQQYQFGSGRMPPPQGSMFPQFPPQQPFGPPMYQGIWQDAFIAQPMQMGYPGFPTQVPGGYNMSTEPPKPKSKRKTKVDTKTSSKDVKKQTSSKTPEKKEDPKGKKSPASKASTTTAAKPKPKKKPSTPIASESDDSEAESSEPEESTSSEEEAPKKSKAKPKVVPKAKATPAKALQKTQPKQKPLPIITDIKNLSKFGNFVSIATSAKMFDLIKEYFINSCCPGNSKAKVKVHAIYQLSQTTTSAPAPTSAVSWSILLWSKTSPGSVEALSSQKGGGSAFYDRSIRPLAQKISEIQKPLRQFLLLSTISLGKVQKSKEGFHYWVTKGKQGLKQGYDTVRAGGKFIPDWEDNRELDVTRVVVPRGKTRRNNPANYSQLDYNEYIVFEASRIKVQYAVDVEIFPPK